MRQIALINKFPLFLLLAGICTFALSCSSDNDEISSDDEAKEAVAIDMNTRQDYDSIRVDFCLLNTEGQAVTTFKEGEQIIFRLTVTNTTDKRLRNCQSPADIVGEDMFQVFSNGTVIARPWDFTMTLYATNFWWAPQKDYVYECPWQGQVIDLDSKNYEDFPVTLSGVVFIKKQDRKPLPVGSYYTEFKLILNEENVITCHKDFCIIAK